MQFYNNIGIIETDWPVYLYEPLMILQNNYNFSWILKPKKIKASVKQRKFTNFGSNLKFLAIDKEQKLRTLKYYFD